MTVTVYTKPSCVQCAATYRALDSKGIESDGPLSTNQRLTILKAFEDYWQVGGFPNVNGLDQQQRIEDVSVGHGDEADIKRRCLAYALGPARFDPGRSGWRERAECHRARAGTPPTSRRPGGRQPPGARRPRSRRCGPRG